MQRQTGESLHQSAFLLKYPYKDEYFLVTRKGNVCTSLISAIYSFYCPDCSKVIARRLNFNTYITRSLSVLLIKSELLIKRATKFDIAEYLDDDEIITEYLNTVLEEGDSTDIISALRHIAKAQGMTKIAEETGLSRPSSAFPNYHYKFICLFSLCLPSWQGWLR